MPDPQGCSKNPLFWSICLTCGFTISGTPFKTQALVEGFCPSGHSRHLLHCRISVRWTLLCSSRCSAWTSAERTLLLFAASAKNRTRPIWQQRSGRFADIRCNCKLNGHVVKKQTLRATTQFFFGVHLQRRLVVTPSLTNTAPQPLKSAFRTWDYRSNEMHQSYDRGEFQVSRGLARSNSFPLQHAVNSLTKAFAGDCLISLGRPTCSIRPIDITTTRSARDIASS